MDLRIREVAQLLNLDEAKVQEMARHGRIPCYEMNGQIRFSRTEIEDWVLRRGDNIEALPACRVGSSPFNLYRAIHRGGVLPNLAGSSKEEIIRLAMADVARRFDLDGAVLTDLLLDRERLMPTGLGEGIAVPHARDFLLGMPFDLVTVVFPKEPLDYGSLDGKPVHTMFFLFACADPRHLRLLSTIALFCSNPDHRSLLEKKPSQVELLEIIKNWESGLQSR